MVMLSTRAHANLWKWFTTDGRTLTLNSLHIIVCEIILFQARVVVFTFISQAEILWEFITIHAGETKILDFFFVGYYFTRAHVAYRKDFKYAKMNYMTAKQYYQIKTDLFIIRIIINYIKGIEEPFLHTLKIILPYYIKNVSWNLSIYTFGTYIISSQRGFQLSKPYTNISS